MQDDSTTRKTTNLISLTSVLFLNLGAEHALTRLMVGGQRRPVCVVSNRCFCAETGSDQSLSRTRTTASV